MQIVTLKVGHECPFSAPILAHPGSAGTHYCHRGKSALVEVHSERTEDLQEILAEYATFGGEAVLPPGKEGLSAIVSFPECACCLRGRVIPTIEATGSFYLPPTGYREGGEIYQFALRELAAGPKILSSLEAGVEVLSVGSSPVTVLGPSGDLLVPASSFFRGVTSRQIEAIRAAALQGYYRIPRGATSTRIAKSLGISREAYESLLRKAENRIVLSSLLYLPVTGMGAAETRGSPAPQRRARKAR
ncbi:MAG: helix-turn-helix domain-containing protein [Candidatus Thermoplasmatota archaeon]|nr:helix-turn-helix domain-containing protein [Candidatus Thermoplasmatota archaeon]